ncbi:MAG: 4-hydroxy-3-methylbut-2-enyl diphosphate reductase [Pseudomonadota bacterium]
MNLDIYLVSPRGFCAGVERAISIVEKALEKYGAPIYVRHEIVHNKIVVENLRKKGAVFVKEVNEVPENSIIIFSAHGVSEKIEDLAKDYNLKILDATCPLVTKVHLEAQRHEKKGKKIILIGHAGHPEVEGTSGRVKSSVTLISSREDIDKLNFKADEELAYVTQTTLSLDDTKNIIEKLKERFPQIEGPDTKNICYATQNRQNAAKEMARIVDLILVIGAQNSSNSNRLKDIGLELGRRSYLINSFQDINLEWFNKINKVGITAGASAPESLVIEAVDFLSTKFRTTIHKLDLIEENIKFNIPLELR